MGTGDDGTAERKRTSSYAGRTERARSSMEPRAGRGRTARWGGAVWAATG